MSSSYDILVIQTLNRHVFLQQKYNPLKSESVTLDTLNIKSSFKKHIQVNLCGGLWKNHESFIQGVKFFHCTCFIQFLAVRIILDHDGLKNWKISSFSSEYPGAKYLARKGV